MNIGLHVSAAGSLTFAPERALKRGCECFQFFSRSPHGGPVKEITPEIAEEFKKNCREFKQVATYIHAPYFINLASAEARIYHGSIEVVRQELERASLLGVAGVVVHTGSAKALGDEAGLEKAIEGYKKILNKYSGKSKLLIEIAAGAGAIIGDTFEEISTMIEALKDDGPVGVCVDTAHAFASGYDLRTIDDVAKTFKQFEKIVGKKYLSLIHANDSKIDFGGKRDRHEHIGDGKIGAAGFKALVAYAVKNKIDLICETPEDGKDLEDVNLLKSFRRKTK